METKDLKDLVDVFKDYRDLLLPVQSGLADFIDSPSYEPADIPWKVINVVNRVNTTPTDHLNTLEKKFENFSSFMPLLKLLTILNTKLQINIGKIIDINNSTIVDVKIAIAGW